MLASVNGVFNAVAVKGDIAGDSLFYGVGRSQDPTSSSVISDLAEAAAAIESPRFCYCGFHLHDLYGKCQPIDESISRYYLRLAVNDQPGVLAAIAGALGEAGIGILSVIHPRARRATPCPGVDDSRRFLWSDAQGSRAHRGWTVSVTNPYSCTSNPSLNASSSP